MTPSFRQLTRACGMADPGLEQTSPLGSASEMHEGLSMNYIGRLKRAAIPLGAIVALSASAVLAQDRLTKDDLATLAATLGVYDSRCETLPPRLRTICSAWSDCSIRTT